MQRTAGLHSASRHLDLSTKVGVIQCSDVEADCLGSFGDGAAVRTAPEAGLRSSPQPQREVPLPVYFSDPALREAFDERAAILEFDTGLERSVAESRALGEISPCTP